MKYRLKDLCSITKGATGIMKADGGKYPLVALSDERRSHSEFQFDTKAVIVPLISSTGHGHASMKRVHYQEGKFALGNILCAVIPNDEKQLHPKYLHLYLQQFKDSLLVPLMKGAANVSLPMNKLADVEIEVPSLERQLEIIELEEEAAEYKNELEERLIAQDGDVTKLRQAILREALQGKLTKQDAKDGNGKVLLEKIKREKEKLIVGKLLKKEREFNPINKEEILFEIPKNWTWCRLGEITNIQRGSSPRPKGDSRYFSKTQTNYNWITISDISDYCKNFELQKTKEYLTEEGSKHSRYVEKEEFVIAVSGSTTGKCCLTGIEGFIYDGLAVAKILDKGIVPRYLLNYMICLYSIINNSKSGASFPNINTDYLNDMLFPLPPIAEQNRIVKRIEQLMQLCDELQYSIHQSKIENEKLLQGALRDALKKEEVTV